MTSSIRSIKCVLIGDGAVGKTSLLSVFADGKFPRDYAPTIEDNRSVPVTMDNGNTVNLNVWDTAGQEGYEHLRNASYSGTNVFLVCFAVDYRHSFDNAHFWMKEVRSFCGDGDDDNSRSVPSVVLVGTKTDLRDDATTLADLQSRGEAPLTRADGERLAGEIGASCYAECSARQAQGVTEVFHQAVRAHCGGIKKQKTKRGRKKCSLL